MNPKTFKAIAAKWAMENVIPAIAPEGLLRWVFAFAGGRKILPLIDQYAHLLPTTANGDIDLNALKESFDSAFAAQPVLSFTLPSIPELAALGMGETKVNFRKEDAQSLLSYLVGTTTTTQVTL